MPPRSITDFTAAPSEANQWPLWTEDLRLDDALADNAYETTPPSWRAAIKTGLALAHLHFGQHTGKRWSATDETQAGFWARDCEMPAPWVIIAFTPAYDAAARLAAACIPAILAGVPLIAAVCVDGTPQKSVLVSLELTGIEDIFLLDQKALCTLLQEMLPHTGRLVALHTGELRPVLQVAQHIGLRCFEENHPPALSLPQPECFDPELLAFAHGKTALTTSHNNQQPEAVYLPNPAEACEATPFQTHEAFLTIMPGCEGFWLHHSLTPQFFRLHHHAFALR